jgi:hypothetical protein
LLGGQGSECASTHEDDINLERNQFGRKSGEPLELPLGRSGFDHEVAALDVTEVTQSLEEGLSQVGISGQVERQVAYSSDLGRLLCLGGERGDDDAASEHRDEGAPLHHWVLAQVFCESEVSDRIRAWSRRAGSMQEPSFQAGRSVASRSLARDA